MRNTRLRVALVIAVGIAVTHGVGPRCRAADTQPAAAITSDQEDTRHRAYEEVLRARTEMINILRGVLRDWRLGRANYDSVELSMRLLGKIRAIEAVPELVSLVGLPKVYYVVMAGSANGAKDDNGDVYQGDWQIAPQRWEDSLDLFPAVGALVAIGEPSIPPVLDKLRVSDDPLEIGPCVGVLVQLKGRTDSGLLLTRTALEEKDEARRSHLVSALTYLAYFPEGGPVAGPARSVP